MVKYKEKQGCITIKFSIVVTCMRRKELVVGKGQKGGFRDAGDALFLDLGGNAINIYFMINY